MGKQYAQDAALLAEKLFRCACLITGDARQSERLVLDALHRQHTAQPTSDVLEMALYKQLIQDCLSAAAKDDAGSSDDAGALAPLDRAERAAVTLSHFSGFDQASAADILDMPLPFYTQLLKKSIDKLSRVQAKRLSV